MNRPAAAPVVLLLLCAILLAPFATADLERSAPASAHAGETITVSLRVTGATPGGRVVVSDLPPVDATLVSWSVTGAQEVGNGLSVVHDGDALIWEFTAAADDPTVVYTLRLGSDAGAAVFDAVYAAAPGAFGAQKSEIAIAAPVVAAPPIVELPAPFVLPSLQSLPVGTSGPVASGLFLIVLALLGSFLYVRSRSAQPHQPGTRWFGHAAHQRVALGAASVRERFASLFTVDEVVTVPVPVDLTPRQERTILEFPDQQARMVDALDALAHELPAQDTERHAMIAQLKREIGDIQFAVED